MVMVSRSLKTEFAKIPENAPEAVVEQMFVSHFLDALGFEQGATYPQFDTGNGPVDYAARKNTDGEDVFLHNPHSPCLLIELKGRDINLCEDSSAYRKTVAQLKRYLRAANCKSAMWGIITNSSHIQLFRRHGKVIHPATKCLSLHSENIEDVANLIRQKINNPENALTVAVYNNKGGVGKTTTVVNLAASLTLLGKKVLIIDFDPNQQDLTSSLGIPLSEDSLYSTLLNKKVKAEAIKPFIITSKSTGKQFSFDIIPADKMLADAEDGAIRKSISVRNLSQILKPLKALYDYIIIDSPPNWRFFSQSAIYASDVVLFPTKHNNLFSLENAATAIKQFIPEIKSVREDGGPVALPIFFNGEKITPAQEVSAQQEIDEILKRIKREDGTDLLAYFYPYYTNSRKNRRIFELPSYAHIANAAFARIPAAYKDKTAREYYKSLVKEYFL
ncbi:AAA family ATPase [Sphaerothrix gracilis]|uniref:AAA family ATPase n=1 Tax=Sphaerothrix gracilis TaxID=3151835 RepID=UPI0031FC3DC2